ncbi:hypothetical protein ACFC0C_11050 [Streptomyces sp. NPDC056178]|uniref:hypothetical protein n=1 Tax=unclassified Streptomyces TaxID=2593676 RepID=UPI0035DF9E89
MIATRSGADAAALGRTGDTTREEVDEPGRATRATWTAFARTGRPGTVAPPLTCHEIPAPRP